MYQIHIRQKHGCFMKMLQKLNKPAVIDDLHEKLAQKWALLI